MVLLNVSLMANTAGLLRGTAASIDGNISEPLQGLWKSHTSSQTCTKNFILIRYKQSNPGKTWGANANFFVYNFLFFLIHFVLYLDY